MAAGLTEEIAQFTADAHYAQLPGDAIRWARTGITDCLGVMLAGSAQPAVRIVAQALGVSGVGALWDFMHAGVSADQAALAYGVAAHVLDFDDVALDGHPSAVLVPTLLALAGEQPIAGKDMVLAYVLGYEVWGELLERHADPLHSKGWHPTAVLGAMASAVAASRLLHLDAGRTRHALAIAASMAAGLVANFGSMTKSFQVGRAAQAGVMAARLARAGFTGARDALEHPRGYLAALSPQGRVERDTTASVPGESWRIQRYGLNLKKFPICYFAHRACDAMLALWPAVNCPPSEIVEIDAYVGRASLNMLRNSRPQTGLEAKFSIEFPLAAIIHEGRLGLGQLTDQCVGQVAIQSTMQQVRRIELEAGQVTGFPLADHNRVAIVTQDGRRFESEPVKHAKGSFERPLSEEELRRKFDDCTSMLQGQDQERLYLACQSVEKNGNIMEALQEITVRPADAYGKGVRV